MRNALSISGGIFSSESDWIIADDEGVWIGDSYCAVGEMTAVCGIWVKARFAVAVAVCVFVVFGTGIEES